MDSTKKQPHEAQVGDRVWVLGMNGWIGGVIGLVWSDRSVEIGDTVYDPEDFGIDWGFLAADEIVVGGVMVKPDTAKGWWNIGGYKSPEIYILEGRGTFLSALDNLKMNDGDMQAIQEHVRKHSAPKKRSAADAKVGDEVWVFSLDEKKVHYGVIEAISLKLLLGIHISVNGRGYNRAMEVFGTLWGFLDTPQALPVDQPAPDEEKPLPPQLGNVALLIKKRGSDWVKANFPDLWDAYKAAGLEKVRSAADKLNKPGPLAGKIPSLH